MPFLLDENVHSGLSAVLAGWGHDVMRVPAGLKNGGVARMAAEEDGVLITHDSDFADRGRFPPERYPEIVWLNFRVRGLDAMSEALSALLRAIPSNELRGKLFAVDESGFREID